MAARRWVSSTSISFCERVRSCFSTRLTIILARRISLPAPVGVVPPTTNTVVTSGISRNAWAMRSVTARVSAKVEPGGSSIDITARLSSCGGMNPVGSNVVDHSDRPNASSPASIVAPRQRRVARRNRV